MLRLILMVSLLACSCGTQQNYSEVMVEPHRTTTINDLGGVMHQVHQQHSYGDRCRSDGDGIYDCENFSKDVAQGMRDKGYFSQPVGVIKSSGGLAKTLFDTSTGIHDRKNLWAHSQTHVRFQDDQNSNHYRHMIVEPQSNTTRENKLIAAEWSAPKSAGNAMPKATAQQYEKWMAGQFNRPGGTNYSQAQGSKMYLKYGNPVTGEGQVFDSAYGRAWGNSTSSHGITISDDELFGGY